MKLFFHYRILYLITGLLLLPLQASALTLKIATLAPEGTSWMEAFRKGAEEVSTRTDDRVQFRFYPGGVMGNDRNVLRKIRIGQLHGGAITGGGLAEIHPDAQIYSLPFIFNSLDEVDFVRSKMDPLLHQHLADKGFVSLGISEGGFAYLMSAQPVTHLEQLRTLKVWVPEGDMVSHASFEAVGVHPVPLPLTDVLTGLQTGLVDTVAASQVGAIALQWHTRVKYLTDVLLSYLYGSLVIAERDFKKIRPADQNVVHEVFSRVMQELNAQNRLDEKQARIVLQQQGIGLVNLEQDAGWHETIRNTTRQLAEQNIFSKPILDRLQDVLGEYRTHAAR